MAGRIGEIAAGGERSGEGDRLPVELPDVDVKPVLVFGSADEAPRVRVALGPERGALRGLGRLGGPGRRGGSRSLSGSAPVTSATTPPSRSSTTAPAGVVVIRSGSSRGTGLRSVTVAGLPTDRANSPQE
jgi:hypothetical protein